MRFRLPLLLLFALGASPADRLAQAMTDYSAHRDHEAAAGFGVLAQADSAIAETMLGQMYAEGRVGSPDPATAVAWWLRASQRGYPPAQVALARALADGRGVSRNRAQAYEWSLIAARRGDGAARVAAQALARALRPTLGAGDAADREARARTWRPPMGRQG